MVVVGGAGVLRLVAFFFNEPATGEIYALSLHGALPILLLLAAALVDRLLRFTPAADDVRLDVGLGTGRHAARRLLLDGLLPAALGSRSTRWGLVRRASMTPPGAEWPRSIR